MKNVKKCLCYFIIMFLTVTMVSSIGTEQIANASGMDYAHMIGSSHVGGTYYLDSSKDYLNEGADVLYELGSRCIKLWFSPRYATADYIWNTNWPTVNSLKELAQTQYYMNVFSKFDVIDLEAYSFKDYDWHYGLTEAQKADIRNEFYELAKYLLTTYSGTGKTFILQNWEADNAMAEGPGYSEIAKQGMIDWANARMDGIIQARNEVGENGVRVMGAFEVCSILFDKYSFPKIVDVVVPYTHFDLYSFSYYEWGYDLTTALNYYASKAPDDERYGYGNKNIYLGEYGKFESWEGEVAQRDYVKQKTEEALAWGCPYLFYWEVFCNEYKNNPALFDDLNDWSRVYQHSGGWQFDSSNPQYFDNDTSRIKRASDTTQFVTYYMEGDIYNFYVNTFYGGTLNDKIKIFASHDNSTWIEITTKPINAVNTGGIWYKAFMQPLEILPSGMHYLKIQLSNDTSIYSPQLESVIVQSKPVTLPTNNDLRGWWLVRPDGTKPLVANYYEGLFKGSAITDNMDDWSKVYSHSANLNFDGTNLQYFENDTSRVYRIINTEEYIVYNKPNISSFDMRVYYYGTCDSRIHVYTSSDSVNWSELAVRSDTPYSTGSGWYRINFFSNQLPAQTNFIKIVLHDDLNAWSPQIGKVTITNLP